MYLKELKSGGPMSFTDEELMLQFQNGHVEALEQLYDRYRAPLYRFIFRYSQDDQLSMDIVQDTFLKLQQKKYFYSPERGKFKTYLFQIAYNTMVTKMNAKARWRRLLPFLYKEPPVFTFSSEEKMDVEQVIRSLPEGQRAVLLLYYYHDLSQHEIAKILNIPLGTVKSRLHHAIQRIRKEWGMKTDGKGS
jgi:RNA polymerase sigma-70 factor, ECF subfamily